MPSKKLSLLLALMLSGFTIAQGFLSFLVFHDHALINQISLHYSDELVWYVLYILTPLVFGLLVALCFRQHNISKSITFILYFISSIQLISQVLMVSKSSNHWGYYFKRPAVFSEVSQAYRVINLSYVFTNDSVQPVKLEISKDTSRNLTELYGRKDPYYGNSDRALMVFEDNAHIGGYLYDFPKIYKDSTKKAKTPELNTISTLIFSSDIIQKEEPSYRSGRLLSGVIIDFQTKENERYLFAGLSGPEISNDHYPFYEFLFRKNGNNLSLLKKQQFYYDIAGIEGFEYTFFSPILSLVLTILLLILILLSVAINYARQRLLAKQA
ncbi:MAG: hypothetical protein ACRYFX_16620 [Janthinobacterium lividum]